MKYVRRIVYCLLLTAAVNALPLVWLLYAEWSVSSAGWLFLPLAAAFLWVNLRPIPKTGPTKRIQRLAEGCELLWLFCVTATATVLLQLLWLNVLRVDIAADSFLDWWGYFGGAMGVLLAVILEAIVFWNGMIRVYLTSVQLGIKHRVLAALCGWIPLVNLWYLAKILRICRDEVEFETQK